MSTCEIARTLSLFEIDEALDLLIESAAEQVSGPEGELSDELRTALTEYINAFGEKVDRIANYIKAQESIVEAAKKEESRLEVRRKSTEHRIKVCKGFVCWFMTCRSLKRLKGRLNTFTLVNNSSDSLVVDESSLICPIFRNVTLTLPWAEWQELLSVLPDSPLRSRLRARQESAMHVDRPRLAEALKSGQVVPGAQLVRGQHVRLT
jgi:hypothetical protein